ncbi:MAG: hypothetical protein Q4B71_01570 [Cardiobacteriaceae bacterium]|nr:hypothetical protein [Cardiobacteriaceae bacterium]
MSRSAYHALWLLIISATFFLAQLSLDNPSALFIRSTPPLQLTAAQQSALAHLPAVKIEAYVQSNPRMRRAITETIQELKPYIPHITLQFQSLEHDPISAQARGISREGQLYLTLEDGKQSRVDIVSPLSIANALLRLQHVSSSKLLHIQGHGERAFLSDSAGSWRAFYQLYQGSDLLHAAFTQGEMPLPKDSMLVIADPQSALSEEEEEELRQHIAAGNHLLYTTDTQRPYLPKALRELSGLVIAEGVMVDADAKKYGLENPEWLVIEQLGDSAVTRELKQAPILATAVALLPQTEPTQGFTRTPLLWSSEHSWSETNPLATELKADEQEAKGSLPLAWQLSRPHPKLENTEQYLFILGDSDLGNSVYFSGGNRALLNQILATMRTRSVPQIQNPERPDQYIQLSPQSALGLGVMLIACLPLLPLLAWGIMALKQRRIRRLS